MTPAQTSGGFWPDKEGAGYFKPPLLGGDCPDCVGTGVSIYAYKGYWDDVPCDRCNGSGDLGGHVRTGKPDALGDEQ